MSIKNHQRSLYYSLFAILLSLIMLATCCLISFNTTTSYASTINEEDLLESYLTNSDISDEYIDTINKEVEIKYEKYIKQDSYGHLYLDVENITSEDYDLSTIDMILSNISIMNQLVDDSVAIISDNNELEIIDDEFAQQWAFWGFSLKWNKLNLQFDKDVALVFGFVFLIVDLYINLSSVKSIATWMSKMDGSVRYSTISAIMLDVTAMLPADIGSGIVGYFSDSWILSYLADILPVFLGLMSSTSVLTKVVSIILPIILPSIVDCAVIIYNALKYNKGVDVKFCWIPWFGDKWGLSLKSI